MKQTSILITILSFFLLTACVTKQANEAVVTVTIEPQRYFAEKIAGDKFKINCVVPAGQSPETYDPTPQQMIQIGRSIAYLRIGPIGFEQAWMDKIRENNPKLQVFDTSEGMNLLTDTEDDDHAHEHGTHDHDAHAGEEAHHHHHGGVDPHIWSSIAGAKAVAWNTLNAFIELDPENTEYFWQNYNKLVDEIDKTNTEIKQLLDPLTDRTFIIYHPALTYFANEFNLTQLCIEMDGKEPSPAQLKRLVETARANNARVVFIQQEFDQKNAELIAKETGCKLTVINPLAYDWTKRNDSYSKKHWLMDKLIEIDKITAAYGNKTVLKDVSLTVWKDDFLGIIGPNGGGKTTLLKVILGLLQPVSGAIRFYQNGVEVSSLRIGYLPQLNNIDRKFPISVWGSGRFGTGC